MNCPNCNKGNAVLITAEATGTRYERKGIAMWILLFPYMLFRWIFRAGFGRRQRYYKKTYYHCNYCNHDFPQSFEEENKTDSEK